MVANSHPTSPYDFEQHKRRILFGVPNRGKVCTERHVPGFAAATKELASTHSVNLPVICVTVGEPAVTDAWAKDLGVDGSDVAVAADEKTHLTRFLGLELGNEDDPSKPQSLRWAAIVDNGVLIRAVR